MGDVYELDDDYDDDENHNSKPLNEESKCLFDILTIEEYDSGGALIQSKKYCNAIPKKLNTTNAVTVKFVFVFLLFLRLAV